jgi:serine/threonine protein kinase
LVFEFCVASLDQCFLPQGHERSYKGPMPSHEQFFFQLATGLQFIHGKALVHGSIKPSNILIHSSTNPQIKISEFGFTLSRWNNETQRFCGSGFLSDDYWIAPEFIHAFNTAGRKVAVFKPTKKSDVFATGKVLFYYYYQCYTFTTSPSNLLGNEEHVFSRFLKTFVINYIFFMISNRSSSIYRKITCDGLL